MRQPIDLEARYRGKVEDDAAKEYYRGYLDDFKRIQDLLYDKPKVIRYLRELSTAKARQDVDARLSEGEGAWAASKPILLANTSAFTPVLNKGQMFVDTVAPAHGVHAHRLQWNVIGQDIAQGGYNHTAVELFRESSRAWWRENYIGPNGEKVNKGRYMWEQIVDALGDLGTSAFTSPEALTEFIVNAKDTELADLSAGIKAAEASRRDLRNARIKHYAMSDHFQKLREWAKGERRERVVERDDTFVLEGWTYTGFIAGAWMNPPSDIKQPKREQPVPTVAYRPEHDPRSRPP